MSDNYTTPKNDSSEKIKVVTDDARLHEHQDLSGITIKNLERGLWWTQNAKFIKRTVFWFFVTLGGLAWLYTIYHFGFYVTFGMRRDNQMINELVYQPTAQTVKKLGSVPLNIDLAGNVQVLNSTGGRFDIVAKIANPNPEYYAAFRYYFVIAGTTTPVRNGFILPDDRKHIVELGFESNGLPSGAELKIEEVAWQRINRHQIPDWQIYRNEHLKLPIENAHFSAAGASGLSEKINVNLIDFTITNQTAYNYYEMPLYVYVYAYDRLVGVTRTTLDNFAAGDTRQVKLNYPAPIEQADRVDVVPDVNIMSNDIYFKFRGATQE